MIRPPSPPLRISAAHSCDMTNVARTFVSMMRWKSSTSLSSRGCQLMMPALLTQMSRRPNAAPIPRTPSRIACSFARSSDRVVALPPSASISVLTSSSFVWSRATRTTCAPAAASPLAMGRPSPRDAPVTSATLSLSEKSSSMRSSRSMRAARLRPCRRACAAALCRSCRWAA